MVARRASSAVGEGKILPDRRCPTVYRRGRCIRTVVEFTSWTAKESFKYTSESLLGCLWVLGQDRCQSSRPPSWCYSSHLLARTLPRRVALGGGFEYRPHEAINPASPLE
ncbi:hypothetical protein R1flu_022242 [Riccia fluitans]|uniref:Uncharacterized protein n=1 Tax=Riccia fluitans TaxID=41844 RepID=A0ABD1ZUJ0_9MARC